MTSWGDVLKIDMKMTGVEQALKKIKSYQQNVSKEAKKEIVSATLAIEGGAVARTVVDTGNLKNSNGHRISNDGMSGEVFNSASYAYYVEFPTSRTKAQPFMIPSYEQHIPKFYSNMAKILKTLP